mmetsp:Transcript_38369/g.85674  ORF Transcript_38369/g.85674 Transcript_38369/m.85674 type:complete len:180 (+) Transcript_38369:623-1162(+)
MFDDVVNDLEDQGLVEVSEGALVVWLEGTKARDGESRQPLLVRKSDGGYMYATTDLAALTQRLRPKSAEGEGAARLLYVTDAGQAGHFQQVFEVGRRAGLVPKEGAKLEHVAFGLVQGEDGKKFATRSGETAKLKDLLDEACKIAKQGMLDRAQEAEKGGIDEAAIEEAAKVVGIGAVK